jgi:hypothetical protein
VINRTVARLREILTEHGVPEPYVGDLIRKTDRRHAFKWLENRARDLHPFFKDKSALVQLLRLACSEIERGPTPLEIEQTVIRTATAPRRNKPLVRTPQTNQEDARELWLKEITAFNWRLGCLDQSSYFAALSAAELKVDRAFVEAELARRIEQAGDSVKPQKLASQISRAYGYNAKAPSERKFTLKTQFVPEVLRRIALCARIGDAESFLAERSLIAPARTNSESFLKSLYRPDEKVLVFTDYESQGQILWPVNRPLPTGSPDGVWFLVNPVDGRLRRNPRQDGKPSRRSEESITSFRFAVVESDQADTNDWLRCLIQMPLRIATIFDSGKRSIHAIVQVDAKTKTDWDDRIRTIKPHLVSLGADIGALTAVRLSRLPQTWRGERLQRLLYLSPNPDNTPIIKKSKLNRKEVA